MKDEAVILHRGSFRRECVSSFTGGAGGRDGGSSFTGVHFEGNALKD